MYKLEKGAPFDEPHLRALKLYTDFTEMCDKFCAILREGDPKKVAQIAHWAKTLTETIQCFGSRINVKDGKKTYYRGVNKTFVFRMVVSRFHLPQSTTSSVKQDMFPMIIGQVKTSTTNHLLQKMFSFITV